MRQRENRAVYSCRKIFASPLSKWESVQRKRAVSFPKKKRRITAYHEAGHAILFHVLPDVGPVHTVSVIPTGHGARPVIRCRLPEKDEMFNDQR